MTFFNRLQGIYAAALTPLDEGYLPDLEALPILLDFLARRGCHGALLLGTTGEGPSFSYQERLEIFKASLAVRQVHPQFRLLAGTGTPNLPETIALSRAAFDLEMDGVVILPPYYYRNISDEGLFVWYSRVIQSAVPTGGAVLGYHIPAVSGVALSIPLLMRLKDTFPERFAGIKDSSNDPNHAQTLGRLFGKDLTILTGSDVLLTMALDHQAAGCITAMANLFSPYSRQIYEAFLAGKTDPATQSRLDSYRTVMNRYSPAPPLIKALLHRLHHFPLWSVRPPLLPLPQAEVEKALESLEGIGQSV